MDLKNTPSPALIPQPAGFALKGRRESDSQANRDIDRFTNRLAGHLPRLDLLGVHYRHA
jgi:hypothetical protein